MDNEPLYDKPIKFINNPNVVQLHDSIFLYKNFLDQDTLLEYNEMLKSMQESDWHIHGNFYDKDHEETYWGNKCSPDIVGSNVTEKILNLVTPNFWTLQIKNFVRLQAGEKSPLHDNLNYYKGNTSIIGRYKISLYLNNDYKGGDIVFPNLNFRYHPKAGDLLIFKIDPDFAHYTEFVTSGIRYAYNDIAVYNPGYFMP